MRYKTCICQCLFCRRCCSNETVLYPTFLVHLRRLVFPLLILLEIKSEIDYPPLSFLPSLGRIVIRHFLFILYVFSKNLTINVISNTYFDLRNQGNPNSTSLLCRTQLFRGFSFKNTKIMKYWSSYCYSKGVCYCVLSRKCYTHQAKQTSVN